MAEVRVVEEHNTDPDTAITRIADFEDMLKKFRVTPVWKGKHAKLKGTGVSGSIDIDATAVTVVVKLGMLARAAGIDPVRLEGSIRKRLRKVFGNEEA